MYIVLEGIVGSGKTTQVKRLVEYFESVIASGAWRSSHIMNSSLFPGLLRTPGGLLSSFHSDSPFPSQGREQPKVIHVREPGTTPIAEDIRHLAQVKHWEEETMHPLTNAFLYAAARAQTLKTVVAPALERGNIVISDRSFLSSCPIQGEAQGLGINTVLWINKEAVGKVIPDIIFYLDIDIDIALARTFDSTGDKFEREGRVFYEKIVRGYEKVSKWKKLEGRWVRIDANRSEEEVFESIVQYLNTSIKNKDIGH